jgi:flavin-dependent thymidylate synthase
MNKNKVELLGYYGSDLTHAQSAWTSTSRDLNEDKINRIPSLLKMLAENGHETPFEKSSFHFLVNVDQASHIHILKHRIGVSVNGESARYKELKEDKYYLPSDWGDIKITKNIDWFKKESGLDLITEGNETWKEILEDYTNVGNFLYHRCLEELTPVIGRKRAKESARFFKTFNSQITMDVMFNWRSFVHFYNLRSNDDAQLEIREISEQMMSLIKNIEGNPFKHTIEAFKL